jgi:hypothetical protein
MNNAADFPIFYYQGDRQGSCVTDRSYHWSGTEQRSDADAVES